MSKTILAFATTSLLLFAAGKPAAQTATTTTGTGGTGGTQAATLASTDFTMYFEDVTSNGTTTNHSQISSTDLPYHFNRSRCECGSLVDVYIQLNGTAASKLSSLLQTAISTGVGKLFIGSNGCLSTDSTVSAGCTLLDTGPIDLKNLANRGFYQSPPISITTLFDPANSSPASCESVTGLSSTVIWFWVDVANDGTPDISDGPTLSVPLNSKPPDAPTLLDPLGGNEALVAKWTPSPDTPPTLAGSGYAVFCVRGDANQVFKYGTFGQPYYSTPAIILSAGGSCPATVPSSANYGAFFSGLDPNFLCSPLLDPSLTSYRITGLQNGIWYGVGVAAVDRSGNITPVTTVRYGMPVPTVDFYTQYTNEGGQAKGGYCSIDSWHTRPGAIALFCVTGLGLTVLVRRRRKGRGKGSLVLLFLAGTLGASQAQAQTIDNGDSFEEQQGDEIWTGTPRQYAIEARFGLYSPNVDSEFSGKTPQSFIFGTKRRPMWQIEFDWEFLRTFGTLSAAGSIGYYKESASSCNQAGLDTIAETCKRSPVDITSLRLIPVAALLVYRMDEALERWKVPLVPYVKLGLNYTLWTVNDGNGNVPTANGGRGQGGTLGWQAAVGISLALDFLDPGAARGFDADSGVNHTFAFFELDHIDSSGLGKSGQLHVGDSTWFTGLMFEF